MSYTVVYAYIQGAGRWSIHKHIWITMTITAIHHTYTSNIHTRQEAVAGVLLQYTYGDDNGHAITSFKPYMNWVFDIFHITHKEAVYAYIASSSFDSTSKLDHHTDTRVT